MVGEQIKGRSLQRELNRLILWMTLGFTVIAGIIAGVSAFHEAQEAQDDVLIQIARWLDADTLVTPSQRSAEVAENDIVVQSLSAKAKDRAFVLRLPAGTSEGLNTIESEGVSWRVMVTYDRTHPGQIEGHMVAQKTKVRDEVAFASSISAIMPIGLLAAALLVVINLIIKSRLKPVIALAQRIDRQSELDLSPFSLQQIPSEIAPFIISVNRLLARTEDAMSRQQRFIADASHELRTPVTALSLLCEGMDRDQSAQDYRQRQGLVKQGIDRLNTLVAQLLDLARLQNALPQQYERVSIKTVVEKSMVLLYPLAEAKKIDLGLLQSVDAQIDDYQEGLHHIIVNGLNNAITYSSEQGRIDVSIITDNNSITLMIEDEGPGIEPSELDKILVPFYRGEGNPHPGNGLGLSICTEIAKQLGGEISLENRAEGGFRFIYQQPLPA